MGEVVAVNIFVTNSEEHQGVKEEQQRDVSHCGIRFDGAWVLINEKLFRDFQDSGAHIKNVRR